MANMNKDTCYYLNLVSFCGLLMGNNVLLGKTDTFHLTLLLPLVGLWIGGE